MRDEYSGIKELYEVVLKARTPMQFGERWLESEEPVLYFENIKFSMISEKSNPIFARGGWANMPRVIWEDRSEVQFQLTEGVMSAASFGILLNSKVLQAQDNKILLVPKREGPFELSNEHRLFLKHWPVDSSVKKSFIYDYERDVAQKKVYGKRIKGLISNLTNAEKPCIEVYEDKDLTVLADLSKEYIVDYYYEYKDEALIYLLQKERFNGLFSLEAKFYSKDENDGLNTTNLIYMPKVRVVSDINLRLGERVDPAAATFNIIGMPDKTDESNNLIMKVTRLSTDIDADL